MQFGPLSLRESQIVFYSLQIIPREVPLFACLLEIDTPDL
jgi:hypothetical protein